MLQVLAFTGLGCLGVAALVFRRSLNRGIYRRHPYEIYALVLISALSGVVALSISRTWLVGVLALVEVLACVAAAWYFGVGSRFPRAEIPLKTGDFFPTFSLTDSSGSVFDSESLIGESGALYLFYRGDW